jgi:hypothetical protein
MGYKSRSQEVAEEQPPKEVQPAEQQLWEAAAGAAAKWAAALGAGSSRAAVTGTLERLSNYRYNSEEKVLSSQHWL